MDKVWKSTWEGGSAQVEGSAHTGYLWDVFKGEEGNLEVIDCGVADTKRQAFAACRESTNRELKFTLIRTEACEDGCC